MNKYLKYGTIVIIAGIIAIWFFVFYLPTTDFYKNIFAEKGKPVTAVQIVSDFIANEDSAFAKYSGKLIEVNGEVLQSQIENGKTTVLLKSNDEFFNVYFVLKDSIAVISTGSNVKLKGFCTGFLGDVQFNEGELVK